LIDWSYEPEWCDKELSRILARFGRRPKSVDMLVKVRLLTGEDQWILLHLEVQSGWEAGFEFRIFRYNSGLVWIYEQRVITLVVLADLDEAWRPAEYAFRLGDFESRLRFPVCKLIDKLVGHRVAGRSLASGAGGAGADRGPADGQRPGRQVSRQVAAGTQFVRSGV
jgi:hypothetical protein